MVRPPYLDDLELEFAVTLGSKPVVHTEKVTILIAHRDRYGSEVPDIQQWVKRAEDVLSRVGGGATSVVAQGVWLGKRVSPLREDTTLVYTYAPPQKIALHVASIRRFVFEYGQQTGQEQVAVLLENSDGDWFLQIPINGERRTLTPPSA